jgi:plasmid stability protein
MPTLYVENVPEDLYTALRKRARENRTSISAEVLGLLRSNVPTSRELARRQRVLKRALNLSNIPSEVAMPSTEELQREDRRR